MDVIRSAMGCRDYIADLRRADDRPVALIPALAPLHRGHMSLAKLAHGHGQNVILTMPVPQNTDVVGRVATPNRPTEAERADANEAAVAAIYAPAAGEIYPPDMVTRIFVDRFRDVLCTSQKAARFDAALDLLARLLNIVRPDRLYLGQKSWQLLLMMRQMVRDLQIPVEVTSGPTVREGDGLAISRRNERLTPNDRAIAPQLFAEMTRAAERISQGEPTELACVEGTENLIISGIQRVEYFECRDARTLRLARAPGTGARVFGAVQLGGVRILDNIAVPTPRMA